MEKTVKDVTPALQTNSEGLKKVLEELVKQYKRQQEEMEKWKVNSLILPSLQPHSTMSILQSSRAYLRAILGGPTVWAIADECGVTQKKNNIQVVQQ